MARGSSKNNKVPAVSTPDGPQDRKRGLFDGDDAATKARIFDEVIRRNRRLVPRHARMDFWLGMYLLYDFWQDNKPLGERRFVSNEPMVVIDTSHRIISRYPTKWNIAYDTQDKTDEEEQRVYGDIERALYGFAEDIDDSLYEIGDMSARKWAAGQILLRGQVVTKTHLTEKAERDSNIVHANYDSRFVLPEYYGGGLDSIICMTPMDAGELASQYPHLTSLDKVDPSVQVMKVEAWDRTHMGVGYSVGQTMVGIVDWCIPPVAHGFFGEDGQKTDKTLNRLPFVIRDANGLAIREKITAPFNLRAGNEVPRDRRAMLDNRLATWRGTRRATSEKGRSMLASIERHYAQFNEAVASIWQHFSLDTFGVYFLKTRGGYVPESVQQAIGSGGVVGIERTDDVQKFQPTPVNPAGVQFLQIIADEREKGTISPILQAMGNFESGFQMARAEQVALTSLEPYIDAQKEWASGMGQLILDQIALGGLSKKVKLTYSNETSTGGRSYARIEFDPGILKQLGRLIVTGDIEPALPTDMMERAQIANLLTNGRRPLLSRSTTQERILKVPDPSGENDRIWNDIAETDPTVIMMEMAAAARRRGDEELALMFEDRHKFAMAMEMAQQMMVMAQMQGMQQGMQQQMGGGMGGGMGRGGNQATDGNGAGINSPAPQIQSPEMRGEGREQGGAV